MGPAVCYGPGAISMKENWVQGAPLQLHTQLHMPSEPHTTVNNCPLQSSLRTVPAYRCLQKTFNSLGSRRGEFLNINWKLSL